jgi:hypothetical protein
MHTFIHFDELLDRFGQTIGLPGLRFDDQHVCHLHISGDAVSLGRDVEFGVLFFYAVLEQHVASVPEGDWVRHVLNATMSPMRNPRAPMLGLDNGRLIAHFSMPAVQAEPALIGERLLDLTAFCRSWSPMTSPSASRTPGHGVAMFRMA